MEHNILIALIVLIIAIVAVAAIIALVALTAAGLFGYHVYLPKLVNTLADRRRWILRTKEQGYGQLQNGESFERGVLQYAGHYLTRNGDQEAVITAIAVVPPRTITGRFEIWFAEKFPGYIWMGFGFDGNTSTQRLGKLKIQKLKLMNNPGPDVAVENRIVDAGPAEIEWLAPEFPRAIFVSNVESDDGFLVGYLMLFTVRVVVPYRTFAGKDGRAYAMIDEALRADWREGAQFKTTLLSLYQGHGEKTVQKMFFGTDPASGTVNPTKNYTEALGVEIVEAKIIDWSDNAGSGFHTAMNQVTMAALQQKAELAQLARRSAVATGSIKTLAKEEAAAKSEATRNAEMLKALQNLSGGNAEVLEALTMAEGMDPEQFREYLMARAFQKTQIAALLSPDAIASLFSSKAAKPEKKDDEEKKDGDKRKGDKKS